MSDLFRVNPMETQVVQGNMIILKAQKEGKEEFHSFMIPVPLHEADFIKTFLWSGMKPEEKKEWFTDFLNLKDEIIGRTKSSAALLKSFLELKKELVLKADKIILPQLYPRGGWCSSIHSKKESGFTTPGCAIFLALIKETVPTFIQTNLSKKEELALRPHVKLRYLSTQTTRSEKNIPTRTKKNGNSNGSDSKKKRGLGRKHPRRNRGKQSMKR